MSLRLKLVVLFLVTTLVPFFVIGTLTFLDFQTTLESFQIQKLDTLANIQKNRVLQLLDSYNERLALITSDLALASDVDAYNTSKSKDAISGINKDISETKKSSASIEDIHIVGLDGHIIASTNPELVGVDYSQNRAFTLGEEKNDTSQLFKTPTGEMRVYLVGPLSFQGKKVGVIMVESITKDLSDLFHDYTGLGETGDWGLSTKTSDNKGLLIVPSKYETRPDAPLTITFNLDSKLPAAQAVQGKEATFRDTVDFRGKKVLTATRYIADRDWGIVAKIDQDEAFAPVQAIFSQLVFFIALLIVFVIFLGSFFSQVIIAPIRKLSGVARKLEQGDFDVRSAATSKDEIGQLSRTFNEMASRLKDLYAGMEEKVSKRTRELNTKVQELEQAKKAMVNVLQDLETSKIITEREKAKDEALLQGIGEGLVFVDTNGVVQLMSQVAERMLGWMQSEIVGKKFIDIVKMEDEYGHMVEHSARPIVRTLSEGNGTVLSGLDDTLYYVRKDGTKFPIGATVTPVMLGGKITGAIEIFRDMSEVRAIERSKSDFVTLASHQLRTPISATNWFTEMLLNGDAGPISDSQREYLNEISESTSRMEGLINELLNASRLELGAITVEPKLVNITQTSHQILSEQIGRLRAAKTINAKEQYELTDPIVPCDESLLRIVFENLCSNACKYTPDGGTITVSMRRTDATFPHGAGILISVADTGYGIPKDQQEKIFTKLFRAENIKDKDTNGTGLGLYITRLVVRHVGGSMWFESVENRGSTFYVLLSPDGMRASSGGKKLIVQ